MPNYKKKQSRKAKKNRGHKAAKQPEVSPVSPVQDGVSSINDLNNDCLAKIFKYLTISQRFDIELVCKRWKQASELAWDNVKDLNLEQKLYDSEFKRRSRFTNSSQFAVNLIKRCAKYLENLKIDLPWSFKIFPYIGQHCYNLTRLEISYGDYDKNSIKIFSQLQNLKSFHMDIFNTEFLEEMLLAIPTKALIDLELCSLGPRVTVSPSLALNIFAKLKNLKNLKLMKFVLESNMIGILSGLKNLTKLDLSFCRVSCLSDILDLNNLEHLDVTNLGVTDDFLKRLPVNCQNLISLNVTACTEISDTGISYLLKLTKLEELILLNLPEITDRSLEQFHNLKKLRCGGCPNVSNPGILTLIKYANNLEHLYIGETGTTFDLLANAVEIVRKRTNGLKLKIIVDDLHRNKWCQMQHDQLSLFIVEGEDGQSIDNGLNEEDYYDPDEDDDIYDVIDYFQAFGLDRFAH